MDTMTSFYFTHEGHNAGPLPLYVRFSSPVSQPSDPAHTDVAHQLRFRHHDR